VLMKYISVLMLIVLSGCFSPKVSYRQTNYYDIGVSQSISIKDVVLNIDSVSSASVYRTKMVYRKSGSSIYLDEYNRWSQTPGEMVKQYLMLAFGNGASGNEMSISGNILLFEFDMDSRDVLFAIEYDLKQGEGLVKKKLFRTKVKCSGSSAPEIAASMSKAADEFCQHLKKEIEISGK
jgi:uncharacterized lipoprotein YmbA